MAMDQGLWKWLDGLREGDAVGLVSGVGKSPGQVRRVTDTQILVESQAGVVHRIRKATGAEVRGRPRKPRVQQYFIVPLSNLGLEPQREADHPMVTLDDLAARSPAHFGVPLSILRRERELNWFAYDVPPAERPAVVARERSRAATTLLAWLDCMRAFDLLTLENHQELMYQVLDLRDDTPGKTAKDARRPA